MKKIVWYVTGNIFGIGLVGFSLIFNLTNLRPEKPATAAVIIMVNSLLIASLTEQTFTVISQIKPRIFAPLLLYKWLYQRYCKPSSTTLMARDMYAVAFPFGKPNKTLVVMLAETSWLDEHTLGVALIKMNLILMSPKTGGMGPYGILHIMLHEITHIAGFLGHERNFQEAYILAGNKFKWFSRVNGYMFSNGAVDASKVFHGFVR